MPKKGTDNNNKHIYIYPCIDILYTWYILYKQDINQRKRIETKQSR